MSATTEMKKRRIRRSPEQWRELFVRFKQSGQTREQFCHEQGVVLSSFTRWWGKLREPRLAGDGKALFVEVTPQAESCVPMEWDMELQLGAGVYLRLRRPC